MQKGYSVMMAFAVRPEEREKIVAVAEARTCSLSAVIREGVLAHVERVLREQEQKRELTPQ